MKQVSAQIDNEGLEAVIALGADPTIISSKIGTLTMGFGEADQLFIPGISVPSIANLSKPFCVPVIGDAEPVSIIVDIPHIEGADYAKRVTFIGMLVAESISLEIPSEDHDPFISDESSDGYAVDEAFDEFCGDGGFLRIAAQFAYDGIVRQGIHPPLNGEPLNVTNTTLSGSAEFYLFDDTEEYDTVFTILESGEVSPADIIAYLRFAKISKLISVTK